MPGLYLTYHIHVISMLVDMLYRTIPTIHADTWSLASGDGNKKMEMHADVKNGR